MARRIPKTRYPWNLERQYNCDLNNMIKGWHDAAMFYFDTYIKKYLNGGKLLVNDAINSNDLDQLLRQVLLMNETMKRAKDIPAISNIATRFVRALNTFSYKNVKSQAAIVGIDPISSNDDLKNIVKVSIAQNVKLISSQYDKYYDDIQKDIYQSITNGGGISDVTADITKRTGMSVNHAALIANDQTGKIIGEFDKYRDKAAGSKYYIWRSMEDNRVRPKHRELDGTKQKWDDPNSGDNGLPPGQPIRCRCVADPIF